jgi:tripartite-type tricarboxylate transporter receptor subunit TctC
VGFEEEHMVKMAIGCSAVILAASAAHAQTYPVKPVRIMTVTTGGPYDLVMRGFATGLSPAIGQPVIIENRTGGNFIPATEACARANNDGYTLCTGDAFALSLNPAMFSKLPYDAAKDFTPIIHLGHLNSAVIVNPSVPAGTIQELIALAKAKPNAVTFATAGVSSSSHLYVEYLRKTQDVHFLNVPYKSFPQAMQGTMAGETHVAVFAIGPSIAMSKGGKLRMIGTTGTRRSSFAPDLPTVIEAGVDQTMNTWNALLGPAGIPQPVVQRMNAEFKKLLADTAIREKFVFGQGFELFAPAGGSPEELGAFMAADREKVAKIVQIVGIKME